MATFTIGGGNQGNISPFLTGKATPMSLPPGYLSAAAQQAARLQQGIAGAGEQIGDAIAAYQRNKEQEEVLFGSLERLKPRLEAAAQAGAMADPSSEESALLKAIENFPSKSRGQKKQILADSLMFLDRQEKERDQLDARHLRGLQTDLVKGKVRDMKEGQLLGDALNDLSWEGASKWGAQKDALTSTRKRAEELSQRQRDTVRAGQYLSEVPAVRRAAVKAKEVGGDILELLGLREGEYSVDDYLRDFDRAEAQREKAESDFNQEMMETWVIPHQQRQTLDALQNPVLQQAVRDAAGKVGEVGVDIWEGIKDLIPQQAPQTPEQMFPELKDLDDEERERIRNFFNLKKRQPVGPGGLPQGDLPELPPLPMPDERLRQPLPMIEGEDDSTWFKWDDPSTPAQVKRANEIIPGIESPKEVEGKGKTYVNAKGVRKTLKPWHDINNPNAYKTNPSFQRKAKREGWNDGRQVTEWEKEKAFYTLNAPRLTQADIDQQEKTLGEAMGHLKSTLKNQALIDQVLAQQKATTQAAPPEIPAPTPSRQEPAWLKPYQQQMRYLVESKGHKSTKALRDAVKAAAMERFPEGLKEHDTGHAYVVTNDGKVVFQVKKDIPEKIPVGAPMIFDLPNGRQGFRQANGNVELIPETTHKGTKPTADQSNAYMYGMRMRHNAKAIDNLLAKGKYDPAGLIERVRANVNWDIAEITRSAEDKEFLSASQNWIAAVLRKESGARIDPKEYSDAAYQYFPALGDSSGTIKRKAELRKLTEEVMLDVAGGLTLEEIKATTEGRTEAFNPETGKIE